MWFNKGEHYKLTAKGASRYQSGFLSMLAYNNTLLLGNFIYNWYHIKSVTS